MRIAFDMDGVLADLHTQFAQAAVRLFPGIEATAVAPAEVGASPPDEEGEGDTAEPPNPPMENIQVSSKQAQAVWKYLGGIENFWEGLDELEPGAIARLARLADERRWEIIFVTSRPYTTGRLVQQQSQRWLQRHGFPIPSVFVVHGSRGRIADALQLDVVIDDRPDNCLDVVLESKAGAILVWRGTPGAVPVSAKRMGIAVVPTVAACLDALMEAERPGQEGRMLDRLRKIFGLRTRSAPTFLR